MDNKSYKDLRAKLDDLAQLGAVSALLEWDQNVNVPKSGHSARASAAGYIAGLGHEKFISREFEDSLMSAVDEWENLNEDERFIVLTTLIDFKKAKKLPAEFVAESAKLGSESYEVWVEARAKSDFGLFKPKLSRIIEMKLREVEYLGYGNSPYDVLLDEYEPGATSESTALIFNDLKAFLIPFVERIKSRPRIRTGFLRRKFPLAGQEKFIRMVAGKMGFDFSRGRLDVSVHPFCTSMHPTDVRMTTRYMERDFVNQALLSVVHEAGHGLYEQGLEEEFFGTPLGESVSFGIHEMNSRLWENLIGRSRPFWEYFYPKLVSAFPSQLKGISAEQFYRAINSVEPGMIRVDADEVTYALHVILRFEIEQDLLEKRIKVDELPAVWNRKMKDYLGLVVPDDARGVLQDSHWSDGSFGYFPTYVRGNIYASQLFDTALRHIPNLNGKIRKGNLIPLRNWLRSRIHVHGRRYSPEELITRTTGEKPSSSHFINYLENKYSDIYNL